MGFFDLFRSSSSNNNQSYNNQSYSHNEYNDNDYSDDEYDDDEFDDEEYNDNEYEKDEYSDEDYAKLYVEESGSKTQGIYSCKAITDKEDWEWETGCVRYPHRGFDPWKTIEDKLDSFDSEGAEAYLKNYFRREEKDIFYYFSMAYLYFRKANECGQYEDIQRAKSHIENAARNCNNNPIWIFLIDQIKDTIYYWHTALKEEKYLREDFKKEWGHLIYRIVYSNMDTYLPQMRALALDIRHKLSDTRGSRDFINTVDSDLKNWENNYARAKAEDYIKNGDMDEAAKATAQISDMTIRGNLCGRIINTKLQDGDYDGAAKIATQIGDMGTQTLFSGRSAAGKLLEMVKEKTSESNIKRQLFVVEDVLRRASSLLKDNDSLQSLQKEIQEAIANARNYLNEQPTESVKSDPTKSIETQKSVDEVNQTSNMNSDNESEFIEELKACLQDGIITDQERRLLDRIRKSLGISEDRATELEAMCQPRSLTAEEQEYADEVKACLEDDGVITANERRLLDRVAKSLGISPNRASEIEQMIK